MRRVLLSVILLPLLLALAAPLGAAGTEDRPEVTDRPDDAFHRGVARRDLDVLRLWFQRDGKDLVATMSLTEVGEFQPGSRFVVFFSTPTARHFVSYRIPEVGEPNWSWGSWGGNTDSAVCPEETDPYILATSPTGTLKGSFQLGNPAYVRWEIPLAQVGLGENDPLRDGFAITYVLVGRCREAADLTGFGRVWSVPRNENFLERLVPGFEGALLVAALVGAAALVAASRRRRA